MIPNKRPYLLFLAGIRSPTVNDILINKNTTKIKLGIVMKDVFHCNYLKEYPS